jgi:hypothetical protein
MMTTVLSITWSRLLPSVAFYGDFIAILVLSIWVLRVIAKHGVGRQLPWFALYIRWEVVSTVAALGTWLIAPRFYVSLYWWLEIPSVLLMIGAMQEALLDMYKGLRAVLHWFMPGVLAFVILYCSLRAIFSTSFPGNRIISFALSTEFTLRWSLVMVAIVAITMTYFVEGAWNTRGVYAVIGIGVISFAYVVWSDGLSSFGLAVLFIVKYLPSLGYFFAAIFWIKRFSIPLVQITLQDGMGPAEVRTELGFLAQTLERITKLW